MVSLKLKNYFPKNRTTEGGESKVCRTTEGGELKLKNYFPKNRTTEGGESEVNSFWEAYLRTEPPKVWI